MQDPLAQLRDIHLPDPVSWWPIAPGWWIVIGLFAGGLIFLARHLTLRYRRNLYRRQALKKLSFIKQDANTSGVQKFISAFLLLRQVSKTAYPREHYSHLEVAQFILFLQAHCSEPVFTDLPDDIQIILYSQPTSDEIPMDTLQSIFESCEIWINRHRHRDLSS
jgi:hypothetical protein